MTIEKLRPGAARLAVESRRYRYRKTVDRLAVAVLALCTVLTVALLLVILGYVVYRGASAVSWSFLTSLPRPPGESGGGIANALVGSAIVVGLATLMAVPLGMGAAVFVNEFPDVILPRAVRFVADVLTGVPSIIVGLFAYAIIVEPMGRYSGLAGAAAYAFIMAPIILVSAHEALRLVPTSLREAGLALGIQRWKVILRVALPTARRALLTGMLLAVARALGETAPVLFTALGNQFWSTNPAKPIALVPLLIYRYAIGPYDDWHRQAWAASFVLVVVVLVASVFVRWALRGRYDD